MSYISKTELTASRNCSSIKHSHSEELFSNPWEKPYGGLPREMPSSLGCGELAVTKHFETESGLWEGVWLPQQSRSRPEPRKPAVATLAKVGIFPAWATGRRLHGSFRHCPSITGIAGVLWTLESSLGCINPQSSFISRLTSSFPKSLRSKILCTSLHPNPINAETSH